MLFRHDRKCIGWCDGDRLVYEMRFHRVLIGAFQTQCQTLDRVLNRCFSCSGPRQAPDCGMSTWDITIGLESGLLLQACLIAVVPSSLRTARWHFKKESNIFSKFRGRTAVQAAHENAKKHCFSRAFCAQCVLIYVYLLVASVLGANRCSMTISMRIETPSYSRCALNAP